MHEIIDIIHAAIAFKGRAERSADVFPEIAPLDFIAVFLIIDFYFIIHNVSNRYFPTRVFNRFLLPLFRNCNNSVVQSV